MQVLYDVLTGRPDRIAHSLGAATLASFDYGFDTDGKITSIADAGGTRSFTYDATLQVTGGGYAGAPESYSYDPEGNRTSSHLSATYIHDFANRLRQDAETCYAYDANGNLATRTAKVAGACTGGVTTYEWDVLNRLVRIDNPDATYAGYRYDAQGRRIEKDVNNLSLTRYVYDDDAILLEYDGANSLQARYSHGEEVDQPLAMTRGGQSYFYHTDHLGSVRLLTDAAGAVANAYDYDAFGNLEAASFETVANPYAFTARERDAESGLMFYRARYYDPNIGRFISEDPMGFEAEDLNLYRYVFNIPVMGVDPTGENFIGDAFLRIKTAVTSLKEARALGSVVGTAAALIISHAVDNICSDLGALGGAYAGSKLGEQENAPGSRSGKFARQFRRAAKISAVGGLFGVVIGALVVRL